MSEQSQRPVAVVTGGSVGIGLATAQRLAQKGYHLAICGRDAAALGRAQEQLASTAECLTLAMDLAQVGTARELIRVAHEHFGRLDVLVNNAGRAPKLDLEDISPEEFRLTQALNIEAVFHTTQAIWPILKARGGGVIVNLSSLASVDPFPGLGVYGAGKAWVNLFTRACADEGRRHNIRVFCVAPGAVETRMLRGAFPDFPGEKCLSPDDVAGVICTLCEPAMAAATGQTVFVKR